MPGQTQFQSVDPTAPTYGYPGRDNSEYPRMRSQADERSGYGTGGEWRARRLPDSQWYETQMMGAVMVFPILFRKQLLYIFYANLTNFVYILF